MSISKKLTLKLTYFCLALFLICYITYKLTGKPRKDSSAGPLTPIKIEHTPFSDQTTPRQKPPSEFTTTRPPGSVTMSTSNSKPSKTTPGTPAVKLSVPWKMYGVDKFSDKELNRDVTDIPSGQDKTMSPDACKKYSKKLLDSVPADLQEKMLNGSPLNCYPGKEGNFPKKYKKLLKVLSKYADVHRSLSKKPIEARTLVWQCHKSQTCGGISDRMKGISLAMLLAVASNRRLVLDWEMVYERVYLKPNVINWNDDFLSDVLGPQKHHKKVPHMVKFILFEAGNKPPYTSMSKKQWNNNLKIIEGNEHIVVMVTNMEVSLINKVSRTNQKWLEDFFVSTGLSQFSDHDLDDILGVVFRYLFQLDNKLLVEFSSAKRTLRLTNKPYVGIHLRTGFIGVKQVSDYPSHPKIMRQNKWKEALHCAVSTADKFLGNNSLLFLATDSNLAKEMAVNTYGARFRTLNNYLLHVDRMNTNPSKGQSTEGSLYTLIDLLFLAESYIQVRGSSGYAWVAGLICGPLPNQHLVDSVTCKMDNLNTIHV